MSTPTAAHGFERACWAAAALLNLALCQSLVPSLPDVVIVIAAAVALVALSAPAAALVIVAGLGPLTNQLFQSATPRHDLRFEEALVLAAIAGCSANLALRRARGAAPGAFRWSAWLLIVTTVAAAWVVVAGAAASDPAISLWRFATQLAREYLLRTPNPLYPPLLFAHGVLLALIAAETLVDNESAHRGVLRVMIVAAAAGAVLNVAELASIALSRPDGWDAFVMLFTQYRMSVLLPDVNAAGSYFGMMMILAAGFAARTRPALLLVGTIAVGLWISGSRAAMAACAIVVVAGVVAVYRRRLGSLAVAMICLTALAAVSMAVAFYPAGRNEAPRHAVAFRIVMAEAALKAVAEAPAFGIGPGRLYEESFRYVGARENAHNNFLQIGAELGLVGLLLFATMVVSGLRHSVHSSGDRQMGWAIFAALTTYLLTCLLGHPLLVAGAAYPFWLLLGMGASRGQLSPSLNPAARKGAIALLVILAVSVPLRTVRARNAANLEHAGVGVSMWHRDEDGIRFRWAGGRSAIYIPSSARAVRIPLRHGGEGPPIVEVRIFLEGREANRILIEAGGGWRTVRLLIPGNRSSSFVRVDLYARAFGTEHPLNLDGSNESGALMIGRAEPEGHH